MLPNPKIFIPSVIIFTILFYTIVLSFCHAQEYTNEEYASAIRHAEGSWTYGIKSYSCKTESECRRICINSIKNNKIRFAKSHKSGETYIDTLAKRYAPICASNDPTGLNKNWKKNVLYWLAKENR